LTSLVFDGVALAIQGTGKTGKLTQLESTQWRFIINSRYAERGFIHFNPIQSSGFSERAFGER
jgi:hypothetical protein